MKVVILHGKVLDGAGWDEQDVFVQAAAVSQALRDLGYDPVTLSLSMNMAEAVMSILTLQPLFVFNLVEAVEGKGIMIHASPLLLDSLGMRYTGAQSEAMILTSLKTTAKKIMRAHGIATPDFFQNDGQFPDNTKEGRYIVKSAWEHASIGLDESFVFHADNESTLREKIMSLEAKLGGHCFAEAFIEGREINIALLAGKDGPEILPPAEILFLEYPPDKANFLCYRSKWEEDAFEYQHTPRTFDFTTSDETMLSEVKEVAMRCWRIFNLRGYARVDFRIDKAGRPWVLEVNANPCISPEGGFMAAAKERGLSYNDVIERIIGDIPARNYSKLT